MVTGACQTLQESKQRAIICSPLDSYFLTLKSSVHGRLGKLLQADAWFEVGNQSFLSIDQFAP